MIWRVKDLTVWDDEVLSVGMVGRRKGCKGWSNVPAECKSGVRSCSWKPSGELDLSHTKHTHDPPFCLSLTPTHLFKPASSFPLSFLSCFRRCSLSFSLCCPTAFLFPSLKKKKESRGKKTLLINAWQLQGAVLTSFFHGNGFSVSTDPVSVLVATCSFARAEHIHVLNRRNYCNIPEIESLSRSLPIIFSAHKNHRCHRRGRNRGAEMTG